MKTIIENHLKAFEQSEEAQQFKTETAERYEEVRKTIADNEGEVRGLELSLHQLVKLDWGIQIVEGELIGEFAVGDLYPEIEAKYKPKIEGKTMDEAHNVLKELGSGLAVHLAGLMTLTNELLDKEELDIKTAINIMLTVDAL